MNGDAEESDVEMDGDRWEPGGGGMQTIQASY